MSTKDAQAAKSTFTEGMKMIGRKPRVIVLVVLGGLLALLLLVGCGGTTTTTAATASETTQTTAGSTGSTSAATTQDDQVAAEMAQATKLLEQVSGPNGSFEPPPTNGPKSTPGKKIYNISYGEAIPYFHAATVGIEEACASLGWECTTWDGQFEVNQWLAGIRQAITAKADGIITQGFDASYVKAALDEAKAAGIPVVNFEGFDEDLITPGAEPLFTWTVTYVYGDLKQWDQIAGAYDAAYAINYWKGDVRALAFMQSDAYTMRSYTDGFVAELAKYPTAELLGTVEFLGTDYGPTLQQKADQAALQYPDTNTFHTGADSPIAAGVVSAVRSIEGSIVLGIEGDETVYPAMYDEGIYPMWLNVVPGWEGYAACDALVRIFAGEKPTTETGIGYRLVDKDTNITGYQPYAAPIDYAAAYKKVWGVE